VAISYRNQADGAAHCKEPALPYETFFMTARGTNRAEGKADMLQRGTRRRWDLDGWRRRNFRGRAGLGNIALITGVALHLLACNPLASSPPAPVPTTVPTAALPSSAAANEQWIEIRGRTPAYSLGGQILWQAEPGTWYRVNEQQAGWYLATEENDPNFWTVWITQDNRVQLHTGRPPGRGASLPPAASRTPGP
jgi:hypothetical protein